MFHILYVDPFGHTVFLKTESAMLVRHKQINHTDIEALLCTLGSQVSSELM